MDKIPPFEVTRWVEKYEETAKYDLGGSCSPSLSIDDLINLSTEPEKTSQALSITSLKLDYGPMRGSDTLRTNIAALYPKASINKQNVLPTNGGIGANNIVLQSLLSAGDHVVCVYPIYEQLYQTPRATGADVTLWKLEQIREWDLDLAFLKSSIKKSTKMLILNSPNNPTGSCLTRSVQEDIVQIAKDNDLIIMADEVFRPMFALPAGEDIPFSFLELGYEKSIVTGSLSKAYGLSGTRTGWIATNNPGFMEACVGVRHYMAISVSPIDEAIAAEALNDRCRIPILAKNVGLAKTNIALMDDFVEQPKGRCSWVKPKASTITLVKFRKKDGTAVDDVEFCLRLQEKTGVMFAPASMCFGGGKHGDFQGYVRVQFGVETEVLQGALTELEKFLNEELESISSSPG